MEFLDCSERFAGGTSLEDYYFYRCYSEERVSLMYNVSFEIGKCKCLL